ncbi:hypothetical protein LTR62_001074 [Meristemomyces frigidus]|uniref:Sfi1 spindle body domain-containing protein n=1 Tax=Meristemomyces frigidus TaxID=1508187 RepID=A0AAN7YL78_9PEZI|nr:hypothetical protein LTR62_001074 [Meristemomyces frigidus]
MSDNAPLPEELPELSDEDITLLHQICTLASTDNAPPYRALFAAYEHVFEEQGLEPEHDGVVFRYLLRVGEAAREGGSRTRDGRLDLVGSLKSILQAQGITVLEDGEGDAVSEVAREPETLESHALLPHGHRNTGQGRQASKRRVSFDDARLDETWLSEHSASLSALPAGSKEARGGSAQGTGRARLPEPTRRRARSISSHRTSREIPPKHRQVSSSTGYTSDLDDHHNPTLLLQSYKTQLEQNAEAFESTAAIRTARRSLHVWHDRALTQYLSQQQAFTIATAYDHRLLAKQVFDQWRRRAFKRKDARAQELLHTRQEEHAKQHYARSLLWPAFSHWVASMEDQRAAVAMGARHMLRYRYFHRWKTIAQENAVKARSILARKYLAVWRERLARQQLKDEQAVALCEEHRMQMCWRKWFWLFCSRRVEPWRDENTKRRAIKRWKDHLAGRKAQQEIAQRHAQVRDAARAILVLRTRYEQHQMHAEQAQSHHTRGLTCRILQTITLRARLDPIGRTLELKLRLDLQRKAFRIWHLHLTLSQQANEVGRKRILQTAWTQWNDALRCRALGQRIDERVLVENLYKWVLAERMRLFRRTINAKLMRSAIRVWTQTLFARRSQTTDLEAQFVEAQQRRLLNFGMARIHLAIRRREDAERAATEFASARALPNIIMALTARLRDVQRLNKWAADARFYTLCTKSLKAWHEQTVEQQHARRRNAYATVRARIKIRLARNALELWRSKTTIRVDAEVEAENVYQRQAVIVATNTFISWRAKTAQVQQMGEQATALDIQRLITSTVTALGNRHLVLATQHEQASSFRREIDLGLLTSALKKLQWARFTALRRIESADALWLRNRDAHVRSMLRAWAVQTASRRAHRSGGQLEEEQEQEPESPSLRPASRIADRSASHKPSSFSSPPAEAAQTTLTPAYMRTPSRSRRAGRFRPLPTPAAVTPFAFERSYLVTTPAPLPPGLSDPTHTFGGEDVRPGVLAPQVTPFARKLRAGGFGTGGIRIERGLSGIGAAATPLPAALRSSVLGRSIGPGGGTAKSVRFAGSSRFGGHMKSS